MPDDKDAIFLGDTYRVICDFPDDARRVAGYQIRRVQQGKEPDDWKPLPIVGANVREIRIREAGGAFRVIYQGTLPEAVLVLNAFQKKAQKTPRREIDKARVRLNEYLARSSR